MAKRGRPRKSAPTGNGNPAPAPEKAAETATVQVTDAAAFKKLDTAISRATREKDDLAAAIRDMENTAVEKRHLHKQAWKAYLREAKMSGEELAAYYIHLDHYREVGGLIERASLQSLLPFESERGFEQIEEPTEFEPMEAA